MTSDDFGLVDIDRLADYIGGVLDGPERAEVQRLIATDPQWRETFELLEPGMAAAGAELSAMAAEPMPADVAARIDAALASSIAAATTIDPALAAPAEPHVTPAPTGAAPAERHLSLVPETGVDRGSEPAPRKRRRLRWAVPTAVAAGIVAFAGFGGSYLAGTQQNATDSAASGGAAPEAAAPMMGDMASSGAQALAALPPDTDIRASGRNYTAGELQANDATGKLPEAPQRAAQSTPSVSPFLVDPELAALQRLQDPGALAVCLQAVAEQNGGPIDVRSVDYARFQGAPAVIVQFVFEGKERGWAVGPECGSPGAGAARL